MDKKHAIVLSIIVLVVLVGASISLSYIGLNCGTRAPAPVNITGKPPPNINSANDPFHALIDPRPPTIFDTELKVEKVITGLALPTSMAFLNRGDILILQKDNGMVRLVSDGILMPNPALDIFVKNDSERGLLGIAVVNASDRSKTVFLYYTEPSDNEIRNRVYRYDWKGTGNLTKGTLLLDLPGEPGPNHDGGKMKIDSDGTIYAVIGI